MGLGMLHWGSLRATVAKIGLTPDGQFGGQLAGVKIPAHLLFLRQATVLTSPPTIPTASP